MGAKAGDLREVPGSKAKQFIKLDKEYGATATQSYGFIPVGAGGVYLRDADGNEYIDFTSGAGVSNLGHNHPIVSQAVKNQKKTGLTQLDANVWPNPKSVELKERLAKIASEKFGGKYKTFLCNSGAESVEAAVKLLFDQRPAKPCFIAFEMAFHGRTGYCLPLMAGKEVHHRGFPKGYRVYHFPYPYCWRCGYHRAPSACEEFCIRYIEEKFGSVISSQEINAVFLELPQGEGGVNTPNPKAIQKLVQLCRKYDILIVVDEVQSGMGRTGKMLASEHFGIQPDIITLAKALTNGEAPGGATVFKAELDFREKGRHSNTAGGNTIACAAALAVIEVLEQGVIENAAKMGDYLKAQLEEIARNFNQNPSHGRQFLGDVKGLGLMIGIEVVKDIYYKEPLFELRDKIERECLKRGLLLMGAGNPEKNPVLRMLPPLIITKKEINQALDIFREGLKASYIE